MDSEIKINLDSFLRKVEILLGNIEKWSAEQGLTSTRSEITITEEAPGSYTAQKLSLKNTSGEHLAEIVPVGAWILGANGRVDIIGPHDEAILVDLNVGGPTITTTTVMDDRTEKHTKQFYRGIDEAGWYWIESKVSSKGHKLSKDLFLDLLAEVSNYERR